MRHMHLSAMARLRLPSLAQRVASPLPRPVSVFTNGVGGTRAPVSHVARKAKQAQYITKGLGAVLGDQGSRGLETSTSASEG